MLYENNNKKSETFNGDIGKNNENQTNGAFFIGVCKEITKQLHVFLFSLCIQLSTCLPIFHSFSEQLGRDYVPVCQLPGLQRYRDDHSFKK